jgi:hypothetical protein
MTGHKDNLITCYVTVIMTGEVLVFIILIHSEEVINAERIFFRKPEGKTPSGRPRHTWEDNIKIHLEETGYQSLD